MEQMKNIGEELIQDMKNQLHQQKDAELEEKEVIYLYYSLEELNELLGTKATDGFEMVHLLKMNLPDRCELGKLGVHIHIGKVETSINRL
mgnify:CR=1 FL=1